VEVRNKKYYVKKLAEKYSEITEESIGAIIDAGNKELIRYSKQKHSKVSVVTSDRTQIHFYRQNPLAVNNKYKFIKRKNDAK